MVWSETATAWSCGPRLVYINTWGDPDKALAALRRNPALLMGDPWLMAPEIGLSQLAGTSSRLIRRARSTLERGDQPPFEISELAAAVATAEQAGRQTPSRAKVVSTCGSQTRRAGTRSDGMGSQRERRTDSRAGRASAESDRRRQVRATRSHSLSGERPGRLAKNGTMRNPSPPHPLLSCRLCSVPTSTIMREQSRSLTPVF